MVEPTASFVTYRNGNFYALTQNSLPVYSRTEKLYEVKLHMKNQQQRDDTRLEFTQDGLTGFVMSGERVQYLSLTPQGKYEVFESKGGDAFCKIVTRANGETYAEESKTGDPVQWN